MLIEQREIVLRPRRSPLCGQLVPTGRFRMIGRYALALSYMTATLNAPLE
jgi:hypothetical protein